LEGIGKGKKGKGGGDKEGKCGGGKVKSDPR